MKKNITVTRVFSAPVESVWEIWTDPELVKRWWGPDKFTCPVAKIDFREGGVSLVAMSASKEIGGQLYYNIWNYTKIIHLQSISFITNLADKDGNKINPVAAGMPADFPVDIETIVTFKTVGNDKTEMTVTEYADFGQTTKFAQIGLEQSFDKMGRIF